MVMVQLRFCLLYTSVCNAKRAIILVYLGKAEILHSHNNQTINGILESPSVVKLHHYVKRPMPELKLSRRSIFIRDNYTCQYCGRQTKDLSLIHILDADGFVRVQMVNISQNWIHCRMCMCVNRRHIGIEAYVLKAPLVISM